MIITAGNSDMQGIAFSQHQDEIVVTLTGAVTKETLSPLWHHAKAYARQVSGNTLTIDLTAVSQFDSAGLVFIDSLKKVFVLSEQTYRGASDTLSQSLSLIATVEKVEPQLDSKKRRGFAAGVGVYTVDLLGQFYLYLVFAGELCWWLGQAVVHPKKVRWQDVWEAIEDTGPNALPIIALLGFIIGLILSFQSNMQLAKFGAQIFVVNLVGVGLTRELAALFTAIILAGRTSSAFAAELGTMKINQEIDVLQTLGLSAVQFLVVPRVIAITLMLPLLSAFMIFFAILGCGVFMQTQGYTWHVVLDQLFSAVQLSDFWGGMFKACVFGVLLGAIGCVNGLKTGVGASAVGESTTRAVVGAIITLVVVDGIFAVLFYMIGI